MRFFLNNVIVTWLNQKATHGGTIWLSRCLHHKLAVKQFSYEGS
jgi:hypothetical protein